MTRDEDSWYRSLKNQFDQVNDDKAFRLMAMITYTGRRCRKFIEAIG